jgi:tetrahedral aminopeptidase
MSFTNSIPAQKPVIGAEQVALLERLSNACAVSGDEGEVRAIVLEQIRPLVDEYKIDSMGNVLAIHKAKVANPLRVMLAAHMDEVGFMLVDKEEGGLFRFDTVGGLDIRQLPGKMVSIGHDHTFGVIGARPIHLTTAEERTHAIPLDSLRIDLGPGATDQAKIGDRATFASHFQQIGSSLLGKALDDRLGVASLIELLRYAPDHIELLAAFTVQEEVGLRGARVAAYALQPDVAIALDATPAHDLPMWDGSENTHYNTRLDYGPSLYIADGATLSDPRLVQVFLTTSELASIPMQIRQPGGGGTDAGAIHRTRAGVPSISVSVPVRYAHTPALLARLEDWQNMVLLVHSALLALTPALLQAER